MLQDKDPNDDMIYFKNDFLSQETLGLKKTISICYGQQLSMAF